MIDIKCKGCNKFYDKAEIFIGVIKCSRCHMIYEYKIFANNLLYENARAIKDTETIESKAQ